MIENQPTSAAQIIRNIDNSSFYIAGGYGGAAKGAIMQVFGKDHNDCPGYFKIFASNGTNNSQLIGIPNGTLTWSGNSLSDSAVKNKNIVNNGYISFNCGLILQYGRHIYSANTTSLSISFPINFSSWATYSFCALQESPLTFNGYIGNSHIRNSITLSFSSYSSNRTIDWITIGY